MDFHYRTRELSPSQQRREDLYYQAAKILCAAGLKAKVVPCVVSNDTDDPDYLRLEGNL